MKEPKVLTARFKAVIEEIKVYNKTILETSKQKKEGVSSLKNVSAGLVSNNKTVGSLDQEEKESLKKTAREFQEIFEHEIIFNTDYEKMLAVAKELKNLVYISNPDFIKESEEKELLEFLDSFNPFLSKVSGQKLNLNEDLKTKLDQRINDLSDQDLEKVLANVSSVNI